MAGQDGKARKSVTRTMQLPLQAAKKLSIHCSPREEEVTAGPQMS